MEFIPAISLARRLGISAQWLLAEAIAGRLPSIEVNGRHMFHYEMVRQLLLKRAAGGLATRLVVDR